MTLIFSVLDLVCFKMLQILQVKNMFFKKLKTVLREIANMLLITDYPAIQYMKYAKNDVAA